MSIGSNDSPLWLLVIFSDLTHVIVKNLANIRQFKKQTKKNSLLYRLIPHCSKAKSNVVQNADFVRLALVDVLWAL